MNEAAFAEVRKRIAAAGNILLAAHLKPDGDAIGSTLALADFLKTLGKKVYVATAACATVPPAANLFSPKRAIRVPPPTWSGVL